MNVVHENADAARIERELLLQMDRLQRSHTTGCLVEENAEQYWLTIYQSLKHLEPLNAWSLLECYLLHVFGGNGVQPSDNEELQRRLEGVHYYPIGSVIIHRTKGIFNAFNWRSNVMAVVMPEKGIWSMTPMFTNYTGIVEFADKNGVKGLSNETRVRFVDRYNVHPEENGFGACVSITRGDREIQQDVAFVSLPDGRSVYAEQFRALKHCRIKQLRTGMIGVRNEYYKELTDVAKGHRTLYFPEGSSASFKGFFGKESDELKSFSPVPYLNLDHEMGYHVIGSNGMYYLNRHEFPKYTGVENQLVLNHLTHFELPEGETLPPLIVITMPNRNLEETRAGVVQTAKLKCNKEEATILETQGYLVYWHLSDRGQTVTAEKSIDYSSMIPVYAGNNRITRSHYEWSGRLEAYRSGYLEADCAVELLDPADDVSLDVVVLIDRVIITNHSEQSVRLRLFESTDQDGRVMELGPSAFAVIVKTETL
jgi:hypothetical protein